MTISNDLMAINYVFYENSMKIDPKDGVMCGLWLEKSL